MDLNQLSNSEVVQVSYMNGVVCGKQLWLKWQVRMNRVTAWMDRHLRILIIASAEKPAQRH